MGCWRLDVTTQTSGQDYREGVDKGSYVGLEQAVENERVREGGELLGCTGQDSMGYWTGLHERVREGGELLGCNVCVPYTPPMP